MKDGICEGKGKAAQLPKDTPPSSLPPGSLSPGPPDDGGKPGDVEQATRQAKTTKMTMTSLILAISHHPFEK